MEEDYDDDGNCIVPCPLCMNTCCPSNTDEGKCPEEEEFKKSFEKDRILISPII